MSNRYKGAVISATPPTTTGGASGVASGAWTLEQQMQLRAAGLWPIQPPPPNIEDVFSTYLYTGNNTARTITNGIDLATKGGLVWRKGRAGTYAADDHILNDTVRGAPYSLLSNQSIAQIASASRQLDSFTTTGFTMPAGDTNGYPMNTPGTTYVSWTFQKQPKFFDVLTYTGDSTAGKTVAHNLGSVPGTIIVKITSGSGSWFVYHRSLGATKYILLNDTGAAGTSSGIWNNTEPTSSVFTLGNDGSVNSSGQTYVAYLFAHNAGGFGPTGTDNVISCGSLTADNAGGGSYSGGATVNLGYEPQFVMLKETDSTSSDPNWIMVDTLRGYRAQETSGSDVGQQRLRANTAEAEGNAGGCSWPTATGFSALQLTGGATYIYIAIRKGPMAVPTSSTTVFYPTTYTGTGVARTFSGFGFPPDFEMSISRGGSDAGDNNGPEIYDKLRGTRVRVLTPSAGPEFTTSESVTMIQDGISVSATTNSYINASGFTKVLYAFRRAPQFFDEVCYTGTGSATTIAHNLGITPELIFVKKRSDAGSWLTYNQTSGNTGYLTLNSNSAFSTASVMWNNTSPTASVFTVGTNGNVNEGGSTFVAYLFATCPGVSKVGTYTGTGATQTVNCGFSGGARWALIKRTDSTGDWYVWDTSRGMVSGTDPSLALNSTAAEVNANSVYTITTGFQIVSTAAGINASGGTYIFLAIA